MQPSEIHELRDQIDQIDRDILQLLSKRAELAKEIGRIKKANGLCVFDPSREKQVMESRLNENHGPLPACSVKRIFAEIISACRALQGPTRVAYLGPEGTFSHLACLDHFGSACQLSPLTSIEDIFRQVERRQADFGVVPVENSTEGAVGITLDQLAVSSLKTCGEIFIRVSHALMSQH
ncbi:MAG: chorismate mutase, partial [Deltaproteobacteria bacterium]|nr:chorismate mutase [Deltaproteobacteria bacterium]